MANEKEVASATRPKSLGVSRRTSTTVLTIPSNRLARRQPNSQQAPLTVLAASDPPSSALLTAARPHAVASRDRLPAPERRSRQTPRRRSPQTADALADSS